MDITPRFLQGLSPSGFHRIAYAEWSGAEDAPPLVCVHGLTRNRHDFSALAAALAPQRRVIAIDMPGRGDSDWLRDPMHYTYPQYVQDMVALLARLNVSQVDWVGTSMGGLIGMMLAVQPGSPVRKLVLNDIGPFIPLAALQSIAAYVGQEPLFENIAAVEQQLRRQNAGFAPMTDADWADMAHTSSVKTPEGKFRMHYDPAIKSVFAGVTQDVNLWPLYDALAQPTLLLRGASSDVLTQDDAHAMTQRGPRAILHTIAEAGHAPALRDAAQIGRIKDFLQN